MRAILLTLVVSILLAGCSSVPSLLYKIEVQQGNVITQEMVDKLKPGMTRSQVRFALGSPMINDAFHNNRWDYVYRLEQEGRLVEQRRLTVFFDEDNLIRIDGSFKTSAAFIRPPVVEHAAPIEPETPLLKEDREERKDAGGVPVLAETPVQKSPSPGNITGSGSVPPASDTSVSPVREKRVPRQAPSQAIDRGGNEADQLKE
jgi:outer membrane protein assembly factor BamE